ncbi:MAG: sulfatase-like hydrolase/transferase, partial [Acidobacteria bacterium]|nr:sulfatase-like hydrolase/transferase [Acidobacteriota bacterium]
EKIAQETLVLFFSDNGGPVQSGATNTPLRGAKGTCFEGGIRVPAVMRFPGLQPGSVSRQVMTMMDYFPTLTAAAGVPTGPHQPFDGENLWPVISAGKTVPRGDIFFSVQSGNTADNYAALTPEWKLVRTLPTKGEPKNLLFRIEEDPNETTDLSAQQPQVVATLAAKIDAWRKLHPPDGVRDVSAPPGYKAPPQWAEAASEN